MVVDVVGQRVAIGGRFRLSDRQRGGIPKTGKRQIVGSGNDFAAALSGGRAAVHGVLAVQKGEDGAGARWCVDWQYLRGCGDSALWRSFWEKNGICCVKNARKVFNLAALFALHLPFFATKIRFTS